MSRASCILPFKSNSRARAENSRGRYAERRTGYAIFIRLQCPSNLDSCSEFDEIQKGYLFLLNIYFVRYKRKEMYWKLKKRSETAFCYTKRNKNKNNKCSLDVGILGYETAYHCRRLTNFW